MRLAPCWVCLAACLMWAASGPLAAETPGSSPASPAPVGVTVSGIIECGQGYTSHELYDMKITVLEVLRGEKAWAGIRAAGGAPPSAPAGLDYLLAKIRFEYYARGLPGQCIHHLHPEQFTAYSSAGEAYGAASVATPDPPLRKDMKSGETVEGWLAFLVSREDRDPLLSYSADTGGAVTHGGGKWFLLR